MSDLLPGLDLATATAADMVHWLSRHEENNRGQSSEMGDVVSKLKALLAVGITDTIALAQLDLSALAQLDAMQQTSKTALPSMTPEDLTTISLMGWRAFTCPAREEWARIAASIEADRGHWWNEINNDMPPAQRRGEMRPGLVQWRHRQAVPNYLNEVIEHGRTPAEVESIRQLAAENRMVPNFFGEAVAPAEFKMLADVGITQRGAMDDYALVGLTVAQAANAAKNGVTPGAALAGHYMDVAQDQWAEVFGGLPPQWFPTHNDALYEAPITDPAVAVEWPIKHGPLGCGYTVDMLRELKNLGWGSVPASDLKQIFGGRADGTVNITPDLAPLLAARGLTPQRAAEMVWALSKTSRSRGLDGELLDLPLLRGASLDEHFEIICGLHDAGVTPNSLVDYRMGGCRTTDDAMAAARAGITPKEIKGLRAKHGTRKHNWESLRIASFAELMDVWESESADRYEYAPLT